MKKQKSVATNSLKKQAHQNSEISHKSAPKKGYEVLDTSGGEMPDPEESHGPSKDTLRSSYKK